MNHARFAFKVVVLGVLSLGQNVLLAQQQHSGQGQEKKIKMPSLPTCPVMDEPIDFSVSVATDDGPVFFCCPDCIAKYNASPAKYETKAANQRKLLTDRPKVQVKCPVSGEAVDDKVFIEHGGEKIYFCCKDCIGKYQSNPEEYAAALANAYTFQTKCPVMGEAISPKAVSALPTGQQIYFCCDGCDKKFLANSSKYAANLASQGIHVDPSKIKPGITGKHDEPAAHGEHDHGSHDHNGHH